MTPPPWAQVWVFYPLALQGLGPKCVVKNHPLSPIVLEFEFQHTKKCLDADPITK